MPRIASMQRERTFMRFALVGLLATAVHYATLVLLLEGVGVPSAGIANGLASFVGIATSYTGNRHLVFSSGASHAVTLPRFLSVYAVVALMHAGGLALWTDMLGLPYQFGFLLLTGLSVLVTYFANRCFVFSKTR